MKLAVKLGAFLTRLHREGRGQALARRPRLSGSQLHSRGLSDTDVFNAARRDFQPLPEPAHGNLTGGSTLGRGYFSSFARALIMPRARVLNLDLSLLRTLACSTQRKGLEQETFTAIRARRMTGKGLESPRALQTPEGVENECSANLTFLQAF